jgi:hypothetical protein
VRGSEFKVRGRLNGSPPSASLDATPAQSLTFAPWQTALVDYGHIAYQPYGNWQVLDTIVTAGAAQGDGGYDWGFMPPFSRTGGELTSGAGPAPAK